VLSFTLEDDAVQSQVVVVGDAKKLEEVEHKRRKDAG
jgi:hypothetical protein